MKQIFSILLILQSFCLFAQNIIFVNLNVQGGQQNGKTWADAFPDFQQALLVAQEGNEIWVAQGTYYPTTTTDRSKSFVLKQGVRIYGGFQGIEVEITQRDINIHETILSGNIGDPIGADNSYHVLYGTALDSTTLIDGFTITKGMATGDDLPSSNGWGGGLLLEPSSDIYNTCPVIQNCRFSGNYALIGGAIHCPWEFGNYVNPIIRNCQFVSNRAEQSGGGIYKSGPAIIEKPFVIDHCMFYQNSAFYNSGGALFFTQTDNITEIQNCIFEKDTSRFAWGAGVYYDHFENSHLIVEACTFKGNFAGIGTAICTNFSSNPSTTLSIEILSCNFNDNISNGQAGAVLLMGESDSKIIAHFLNCNFLNNRSKSYATALSISGKEVVVNLNNCVFSNNIGIPANPNGSRYAVYMGGLLTKSNFTNCLFSNNESALGFFSPANAEATHKITNCTFFQNGKYVIDKTNYPFNPGFNDCYITNSIFHDDATFDRMFSDNDPFGASMEGYYIDYTFVSLDDNVTPNDAFGPHTVFKAMPFFVDTLNNDFRLLKCSPAVNAGNNLVVDSLNILTDLDGNPRIRFDTVDLGAYESQEACISSLSQEPELGVLLALLSPNPQQPGGTVRVQVQDLESNVLGWALWDIYGRTLDAGRVLLDSQSDFSLIAPITPGIYWVEIQSGLRSIYLKFIVFQ